MAWGGCCTIGFLIETFDSSFYKQHKIYRIFASQARDLVIGAKSFPASFGVRSDRKQLNDAGESHRGLGEISNGNSFPMFS